MKSVLISIQPKWCELIASGKKTVEVRKTKPKLDVPFKVYVYMTKEYNRGVNSCFYFYKSGKVIGEFVCNNIDWHGLNNLIVKEDAEHTLSGTCLTKEEVLNYLNYQKGTNIYACKNYDFYGWHISDLKIYDKPKELGEFVVEGDCLNGDCKKCKWFDGGNNYNVEADCLLPYDFHFNKTVKPLFRPPQSWCYVESEVTEG